MNQNTFHPVETITTLNGEMQFNSLIVDPPRVAVMPETGKRMQVSVMLIEAKEFTPNMQPASMDGLRKRFMFEGVNYPEDDSYGAVVELIANRLSITLK